MKIASVLSAAVLSGAVLIGAIATPALADRDDDRGHDRARCAAIPSEQWMPIEKAIGKAEALGYTVIKAKRSKGCWEIEGHDRNGAEVEVMLDPASGEVIKPRASR